MKKPGFELRAAHDADVDAFYDLYVQIQSIHAEAEPDFFRPPARDETFLAFFTGVLSNPAQNLTLACAGGEVVGFIQYFLGLRPRNFYQPERRVAYINGLVVDKAHRRAGCGATLIAHVKQEARRRDASLLGIDFWSFNDAARACFGKAGFKVSREFMWLSL